MDLHTGIVDFCAPAWVRQIDDGACLIGFIGRFIV
jgi:hypothetical protein